MWFFLILLLIVLAIGGYAVSLYNGFVRSRNQIQESWRQIDVELNRRYDLIPNLVETVRAFAAHERNTLEQVVALRSQAAQLAQATGGVPSEQRAQVEEQLSAAVRQLVVSVEAYPELKSNVNFLELQRELSATEDRIAAGRRFYNANVRNYNTQVESFPSNFVANMFKFEKATYFEVNDQAVRQAPQVNFGEISDRGDAPRTPSEPTNAQLEAGAAAAGGLPNPQAYQQSNPLAPPPGQFPEPAPVPQAQFPAPQYPPAQAPYGQPPAYGQPAQQPYPPAGTPAPPSYGAPAEQPYPTQAETPVDRVHFQNHSL
ncbi:MAG: LemA family protein, partial [Propionicimonas sp.]